MDPKAGGHGTQPPEAIGCLVFEVSYNLRFRPHLMDFKRGP